ncbi:protoporphyrinogen oxidase HemJ [Candidatus Pelagibacter sp.]|nr:protoporphyrinogen oxidase HemJ [Candidatus Pelagibacter sp.]
MNFYLLFKSLHLISVISWMAGLLYLPRIFVYHAENSSEKKTSEIFKTMERKLFFYIMTPAMILSWIFGVILIHNIGFQQIGQTWMILKIIFVTLLTLYHLYLGRILNQFKIDQNAHSHKFYRLINEIPTLLLILIVFVVVFKPL